MPHSWPAGTSLTSSLKRFRIDERALVNDDVVAQQAHLGAALDLAFGDLAARDLADLRDVEDLLDRRVAQEDLALRGASRPDIAAFTSSTRS